LVGWQDDKLRIRVRARAEKGKGNAALCRLIARALNVPPRAVSIVQGATRRDKLIEVEGIDDSAVRQRLSDGSR
jgi:uncharacterized protein YggU (UPF0235/DUF167 family)